MELFPFPASWATESISRPAAMDSQVLEASQPSQASDVVDDSFKCEECNICHGVVELSEDLDFDAGGPCHSTCKGNNR